MIKNIMIIAIAFSLVLAGSNRAIDKAISKKWGTVPTSEMFNISEKEQMDIEALTSSKFDDSQLTIWKSGNKKVVLEIVHSKSTVYNLLIFIDSSNQVSEVIIPGVKDQRAAIFTNKRWRNQFIGQSKNSINSIDGISGATISSGHLTKAVERVLQIQF
jgi:hypothetical protein